VRAVIYSRFSTDRQTDSSIADQVRVCSEYAAKQGWTVIQKFEDQGISGAAMGNRPGVLRLQEAALARKFDVLLLMDLSRLSRSQGDLAKCIDRLTFVGLRIVAVHDNFDTARDGHELVSGLSGIIGQQFRKMVAKKTYAALESRAKSRRPTGGAAYGYLAAMRSASGAVEINESEAVIVREVFTQFAGGASCYTIAAELNARKVPSPGATWNRSVRRCSGWAASGMRVILINPRYKGEIVWNQSEWRKDPDSGVRKRISRPRSEWITYVNESQRIVSDELWERAQRRLRPVNDDPKLKAGGKPRYLFSGLLRCDTCGGHYTITSKDAYGCLSHHDGNACSNAVRIRKDRVEEVLLHGPESGIGTLLAPQRIDFMAREMQRYYAERVRARQERAVEVPRELQELTARIDRLRERLKRGDPDMAADEIQVAIDRADTKRRELESEQPEAKGSAKVLAVLPRAAQLARRQIERALAGDQRAALKTRVFLRAWFGGKIRLEPLPDGGLIAHWNQHAAALLRAVGSCGSGGRI
jgi:site-specific DNA recombinase